MNKSLKIDGKWWIFGKDQPPHYGVLTYDAENGAELIVKIIDPRPDSRALREYLGELPLSTLADIEGIDESGRRVSLFACFASKPIVSELGFETIHISPLRVLLGQALLPWEDLAFNEVRAEYSGLYGWMQKVGITQSWDQEHAIIWKIKDHENLHFDIDSETTLAIEHNFTSDSDPAVSGRGILSETFFATFKSNQSLQPEAFIKKYLHPFRALITLLSGRNCFLNLLSLCFQSKRSF